jgi:uncharacterized UPF0160 family protein
MENEKFYDISDFTSKINADLTIIGTEDKESFTNTYLQGTIRETFKLIGTHSGAFHCDEALATALLLRTKEFAKSIIVRTRDQEMLDQLDAQVDVGAVFDSAKNRFDHHQKTFVHQWWTEADQERAAAAQKLTEEGKAQEAEQLPKYDFITKLSSAGLIYKFFGKEIITNICKSEWNKYISEDELNHVY